MAEEQAEEQKQAFKEVKGKLTSKQFRRLWMHYVDHFSMEEVAALEKVSLRAIYTCFEKAKEIVNKL